MGGGMLLLLLAGALLILAYKLFKDPPQEVGSHVFWRGLAVALVLAAVALYWYASVLSKNLGAQGH